MHLDSHFDTAAAPSRSLRGRPQVIRPEDLVWPPPLEDLQAFSVIKVGEDDERAAALLIVAGLAAPQAAAGPRGATVPGAVVQPRKASPWALSRWARVGRFANALGLVF